MNGDPVDTVPNDDPLMIEWKKFVARGEYANSVNWAIYPSVIVKRSEDGNAETQLTLTFDHVEGSMWAAFCAGWNACQDKKK